MEKPSKTERKRHALSAQELGDKLVDLSTDLLSRIELPQEIRQAIALAKAIKKHGGRKRQMQYIGALMRRIDITPVAEAVRMIEVGRSTEAALLKQIEQWRDALVRGNDSPPRELLDRLSEEEKGQLNGLVAAARQELNKNQPPASSRLLFRFLLKKMRNAESGRPGSEG